MQSRLLAAAVAALAAQGACAPMQQPLDASGPGAPPPPAEVRVENLNWADMNVYVVQGGARMRLGTVNSMNSQTFRVPASVMRNAAYVRILADPVGSFNTFTSQEVRMLPGQRLELRVQGSLALSSVAVYNAR